MINRYHATILTLVLFGALTAGCGGSENAASKPAIQPTPSSNSNSEKSNVEELSMMVRVPYEAEDIVWKQDPSTRNITAVFRFSPADAGKLVAEAEKDGPARVVSLPVESWYPEELIAQGEVSGDSTLKGTAYSASAFFQEPYKAGRISRIDGSEYFILEVSPK